MVKVKKKDLLKLLWFSNMAVFSLMLVESRCLIKFKIILYRFCLWSGLIFTLAIISLFVKVGIYLLTLTQRVSQILLQAEELGRYFRNYVYPGYNLT